MELTFLEINALHKLLTKVKFDERLDPSEVNHFAASPYISSALRKVRAAYLSSPEVTPFLKNDGVGQLRDMKSVEGIIQRMTKLSTEEKEWIRSRTTVERNEYVTALLEPYEATRDLREALLAKLELI